MIDSFLAEVEANEDRRNNCTHSLHEHEVILVNTERDHPLRGQPLHPTADLHTHSTKMSTLYTEQRNFFIARQHVVLPIQSVYPSRCNGGGAGKKQDDTSTRWWKSLTICPFV